MTAVIAAVRARIAGATAAGVAVVALALPLGFGTAGPAGAVEGCPPPEPIAAALATAPTVFTGTVRSLANRDRTAVVDVIRVWKGGPLPRQVQVRGTIATQEKVTTALDRTYRQDTTYLFVPSAGSTPRFIENQCSPSVLLTRDLAALAPAGGGDPPTGGVSAVEQDRPGVARFVPLVLGLVGALGVSLALLRARRRGRPAADGGDPEV